MSERGGGPAFPSVGEGFGNVNYSAPGMTLRDWFAGQADIPWEVARAEAQHTLRVDMPTRTEIIAARARLRGMEADAMLREREADHDR